MEGLALMLGPMEIFNLVATPVAYTIIALEFLVCTLEKKRYCTWQDTAVNLGMGYAGDIFRRIIFLAGPLQILNWLCGETPWKMDHGPLTWILCFIALDFFEYWDHRWAHENGFLWSFHSVHHSSTKYNFSTGSRQSWLVEVYRFLFVIPLALFGFPLVVILGCRMVHRYLQLFQHTTLIGNIGVFEYIFASPSQHRVHHGVNPQYINKNYGNIFCFWDRIFKTFEPEVAPVQYGPQTVIEESHNPLQIQFGAHVNYFIEMAKAKSWKSRLSFLASPPGMTMDKWQKRHKNPQELSAVEVQQSG